jgi:hypothetical protein
MPVADVIYLYPQTDQAIPVARVLEGASALAEVLVIGVTTEGELYAAASLGETGTLLWLLESFKHALLAGKYA